MEHVHHANLLIGTDIASFEALERFREPGPDIHHIVKDALAIDDVRSIIVRAIERPLVGDEVVFVIVARTINHEAQHALLKLLEEPPSFVRFYLVVPQAGQLLATVRSRLQLLDSNLDQSAESVSDFENFLRLSYGERMDEVAKRTKDKDLVWIDSVIAGAESATRDGLPQSSGLATSVGLVLRYHTLRGSSQKMLLEELALSLPAR